MLKYADYDIVFQEVPDEVSLAIDISNCPIGCSGCHSSFLQGDVGNPLDEQALGRLLSRYGSGITCVCLMGGDADPVEVQRLARHIAAVHGLRVAWYSGRQEVPDGIDCRSFNYIKLGPYVEALGGLDSKTTNQRMYSVAPDGSLTDITHRFWRH